MISKELVLFPGCAIDGAGSEYGHSTLAVLEALGKPVKILDDWNCCGATAARGTDPALAARLAGRNLGLAAMGGCDVLVSCAACYNNLAFSRVFLNEHPDEWPEDMCDLPTLMSAGVHHLLSVLTDETMLERIGEKISRPLTGMQLACYYGCLLVRPGGYTNVDDPENPQSMDTLMSLCGAQTVDWSYKTDCCGGSHSLTDEETAVELMARIFADAMAQGAVGLVTACPLCHMNLDARQRQVGKLLGREISIPIYYFTELLALAMDLPGAEKWLKGHLTDARKAVRNYR